MIGFHRNFFECFKTVGNESWRHDGKAFNAFFGHFIDFDIGIRLKPFVAGKS
jgi:hypothetical protein